MIYPVKEKKTSLDLKTEEEDIKTCSLWEFVFSKGHGVSVLSGPRALLSAVPNWPFRFPFLWMWVILLLCVCVYRCVCPQLLSEVRSFEPNFQIKCHLLAPISADKCPQSQAVEAAVVPAHKAASTSEKSKRLHLPSSFFFPSHSDTHTYRCIHILTERCNAMYNSGLFSYILMGFFCLFSVFFLSVLFDWGVVICSLPPTSASEPSHQLI